MEGYLMWVIFFHKLRFFTTIHWSQVWFKIKNEIVIVIANEYSKVEQRNFYIFVKNSDVDINADETALLSLPPFTSRPAKNNDIDVII